MHPRSFMAKRWPGSSYLLWTNSSSDGNVLRMLSCLLWKWDSLPPYHHPQTLEASLTITKNKDHWAAGGLKPTGCLEIKRLPESAASGMIGRRLEEDSWLRTFTPLREATFCLEGRLRQDARVLSKMRRYMWCLIKSDKWLEGEKSLKKSMKLELKKRINTI